MVKRKLAQISGAALGFIHGNVGGAAVGYKYAGKAYDYMHPVTDADNNPFVGTKKRRVSSLTKQFMKIARRPSVRRLRKKKSSMYKNKFSKSMKRKPIGKGRKRTKRKSKKEKPTMSKAAKVGFHVTTETYGGVSDPNTCYIIHSTYSRLEYARAIVGGLYRKLLKKAGILIADIHQELPMSSIVDSSGFRIVCERKDILGNPTTIDCDLLDNWSLIGLIDGNTLLNNFILSLLDASATHVFTRLMLYTKDEAKYRVHTILNIETEVLHLVAMSTLKVQNRTRGDQATDVNAQTVDAEILDGKVYQFNNACPKVKSLDIWNHEWSTLRTNGMDLIRSAEFPSDEYQNCPPKAYFSNCNSVVNYKHIPGVVKLLKVYWTKSGLFNDILKNLRFETVYSGVISRGIPGKAQMLGVEELIRSDSTNIVQLKYERKYEVGVYYTTHKTPAALLNDLTATNVNQYAP